jgi:pimeloyl-ACP methyl ester carboxylesterase
MPHVQVNGVQLYYEDTGSGDETILFSHGLLWDTRLFDNQVTALSARYRCVSYDHRGQGRSDYPRVATIDMETVYTDAVALIEKLGLGRCHIAGLSMGGFVAMRMALRRPELVRSLVLMATTPDPESPEKVFPYWFFGQVARFGGMWLASRYAMHLLFGVTFRNDPNRTAERLEWYRRLRSNRRTIFRAVNGVVRRKGVYDEIDRIAVPTLILVGEEDTATYPIKSDRLHERIPGSVLVRIPNAGHTFTVEAPQITNRAMREFLDSLPR